MSRRIWVFLLLAAGGAAVIQNIIVYRKLFDSPRPGASEEFQAEEALEQNQRRERGDSLSISAKVLAEYLARLPDTQRNPFIMGLHGLSLDLDSNPIEDTTFGLSRLQLEGTLWSRNRRVAWIGGRPRSEGERVGGYEILRIEPERVVLRSETEEITLDLTPAAQLEAQMDASDTHTHE